MLDEFLLITDKIGKLFSTLKISMICGIIVNLIIIVILFRLTDVFIRKMRNKFQANENAAAFNHLYPIIEKTIKFLIIFFIAASFLQSHGYSLTSFIAGLGITGLAIGFAAQDTIAAMFGTLGILTDKIYKTGDYIKINNIEGTVENISLRSTKIRSLDTTIHSVPNSVVASTIVENISKGEKRKIDVTFKVTYSTSNEKLERAMDVIKEVVKDRNDLYHQDFAVNIVDLDDSSINIQLVVYAKTTAFGEFVKIRSEIYLETLKRFRAEDIEFAFPSTTVYTAKA